MDVTVPNSPVARLDAPQPQNHDHDERTLPSPRASSPSVDLPAPFRPSSSRHLQPVDEDQQQPSRSRIDTLSRHESFEGTSQQTRTPSASPSTGKAASKTFPAQEQDEQAATALERLEEMCGDAKGWNSVFEVISGWKDRVGDFVKEVGEKDAAVSARSLPPLFALAPLRPTSSLVPCLRSRIRAPRLLASKLASQNSTTSSSLRSTFRPNSTRPRPRSSPGRRLSPT